MLYEKVYREIQSETSCVYLWNVIVILIFSFSSRYSLSLSLSLSVFECVCVAFCPFLLWGFLFADLVSVLDDDGDEWYYDQLEEGKRKWVRKWM